MRHDRNAVTRRLLLAATGAAFFCAEAPAQSSAQAAAPAVDTPAPGPTDTCPACGMFVAPYPYWIATVLFADGHADHFDGAKDMFKYLHDMPKYARGRTAAQIKAIGVTGYYAPDRIDARAAVYVVGSDVLGPMGHEFVPLADEAEAVEFSKDHGGKRTLRFAEASAALAAALDEGRFQ